MIYYVRHGATDWNDHVNEKGEKAPRCQGLVDNELNERGIAQAHAIAETLKDVKFAKVISSPLKRAIQTCEIICDGKYDIEIDKRIIERDFGDFEGKMRAEFDFRGFWVESLDGAFDHAESISDMKKRVYSMLDELKSVDGDILIVGHGGIGLILLSYFKGIPDDGCYTSYELPHGKAWIGEFENVIKMK